MKLKNKSMKTIKLLLTRNNNNNKNSDNKEIMRIIKERKYSIN